MTEQPEPPEQPETSEPPEPAFAVVARKRGRARLALRTSMVVMALAIIAFAYFTPVWMDRGLTKANENRLRSIAEETVQMMRANDWSVAQGVEYAQQQSKLGDLETSVDISVGDAAITVHILGTFASANPFASLTGAAAENRIDVTYTSTN